MTAVVATGLGVVYGGAPVLAGVSFALCEGSVTALLGANGAGKSSLMNRMLDLTPGSGTCTYWGKPMHRLPNPSATVGAVIDGNPLIRSWTPEQHLKSFRQVKGPSSSGVQELLRLVGLESVARRRVSALSLGQRQRVGLAIALMNRPRVLLLDEPTTGLDALGVEWLFAMLRARADDGCTVLVSTHQITDATAVADRVLLIRQGGLAWAGTIDDLRAEAGPGVVRLRTPDGDRAVSVLTASGVHVRERRGDTLWLEGRSASEIGRLGFTAQIEIHELSVDGNGAADAFKTLVDATTEVAQ